jgi:hypothetical protein
VALLPPRETTSNVRRLFHQPTLARYRRAGAAGPLGTMLFILVVVAAIVVRSGVRRSATYNGHPWHDTPVVGGHHRRWGYGVPEHSLLAPPRERDGDTAAGSGRRNWVVIIGIAPTAAAVLLVQGLLHGHLSAVDEYDDGVYFGASVELVHGVMAYRSFAFIQPPMITVWMLPFAAASRVVGTAPAMESARFFVDLVTVANMVLVGELVRHRSTLQVAVATGVMAFSLGTIRASQTILLEPFLVLACLLAFLCLADGEGLTTSPRRLWWCGVFLGVGGATKIWAVFPLVAVLIVLRGAGFSWQRKVFGGATLGFVICCLPFIAGAPTMSFTQVVLTQALRNGGGYPLLPRLADLTGIPGLASFAAPHSGLSVIVLSAAVALASVTILVGRRTHRGPSWTPLDRLAGWPAGRLAGWPAGAP